ncbi:MAG: hypothetical protein R3B09_09380 [Nannocystaceae bacterium]
MSEVDLEVLLTRIGAREVGERRAAVEAIGRLGAAAAPAIPRLIALLDDRSVEGPWPSSVGPTGHDPRVDFVVATAAAEALGAIGAPAVEPVLAALRGSGGHPRRYHAALAAGLLRIDAAVPILEAMVRASEWLSWRVNFDQSIEYPVHEAAAIALAQIGPSRSPAEAHASTTKDPGPRGGA